jgi:hypothetical protein
MATPRLAESESRELSDSPSFQHSKDDSEPSQRVADSLSQRVADSGSCFSIMNISANAKTKWERLER